MHIHKGKVFNVKMFRLQPFTVSINPEVVSEGLLRLYSDTRVTRYNNNTILATQDDAKKMLIKVQQGYQENVAFTYFLFNMENNKVIGTMPLISPTLVSIAYPNVGYFCNKFTNKTLKMIWSIEFYLQPAYWNMGIMSVFVKTMINELIKQGADGVIALTDKRNIGSIKVLQRCGFNCVEDYNDLQNQSLWLYTSTDNIEN